jgi:hypothetical protein
MLLPMRSALGLIAACLLAACGGGSSPSASSATSAPPSSSAASSSVAATHQVALWFLSGTAPSRVTVDAPVTVAVARQALQLLLAGPTTAGLTTAIPVSTQLARVANDSAVLSAGFSHDLTAAHDIDAATGQIARTMLDVGGVNWVQILAAGQQVGSLLDAQMLASPDRSDHPPWIELLRAHAQGRTVSFFGTADVFEATVQVRVVSKGAVLASRTLTATCGTGCRGVFEGSLKVAAGASDLVVEAFSISAADGSEQNLVKMPVS